MTGLFKVTLSANPWTPDQHALLQQLRADKVDWPIVSERCGHPVPSCRTTLSMLKRRAARIGAGELSEQTPFGKGDPKNPKRFWTEADVQTLIRMVTVEGQSCAEVDRALGRADGASAEKFNRLRRPEAVRSIELRAIHAPKNLPRHDSITAEFFGDPLPGRSALDRIRAGQGEVSRQPSLSTGAPQ
jgi:hypothetical protein